ncbi:MAG: hypothetical protein HY552_01155 [Elusimicrobia bacterium]|nr:hypothetical protein [Elusimicrobiota bacterium]
MRRAERWSPGFLYAASLVLAAVATYAVLPIVAWDKDLWYHLNGGRWIWEHRALPTEAFFSFLSPPRRWLDYSWLFEVVVYAVYRACGYAGLLLMRAGLLAGTLGAIWALLCGRAARRPSLGRCVLFSLYLLLLLPRFALVRPHLFSYFLLAIALLILERRRRWIPLLPLLAALWGNLHGIYYPILLLTAGAYALEHFLRRAAGTRRQRELAFTAAAMAAVLLTPLGAGLLDIPFTPLDYARFHVGELAPFRPASLFALHADAWSPSPETGFNLLFFAAIGTALTGVARRRLRPAHAALAIGGGLLLTKGVRFSYECALLALPLLARSRLHLGARLRQAMPDSLRTAIVAGLAAMPFCALWTATRPRPRYPLSMRQLPQGIAAFLVREGPGGSVLSDPDMGGYLEWALGPSYKIAADMRTPHLFSDADAHLVQRAFLDSKALDEMLNRYHPDFIAAPLARPEFKSLIARWPRYVPVFFDDEAVLYVDSVRHRPLTRRWTLPVDPFDLPRHSEGAAAALPGRGLPPYLARMIGVAPRTFSTQVYAAQFCWTRKDFRGELDWARRVAREYPEEAEGWLLEGHALRHLGNLPAALGALRKSLRRAGPAKAPVVKREMAAVYAAQGRVEAARALLREADPSFPPDSRPE